MIETQFKGHSLKSAIKDDEVVVFSE